MADSATAHVVYPQAVVLATLSLLTALLIIPPLFWHFRSRNIGATALIAWLILSLVFNSINAILWPNDNISSRFSGTGLCDVEVKIQIASRVGVPASLACILRALAAVMDTDRASMIQTRAQRRRACIIDLLFCVGIPLVQMVLHYIVQPHRYYVLAIAGCAPAVSPSWLSVLLLTMPSALWVMIDGYFASIILVRLYRYRLSFKSILESQNTTRSRFMRLYFLCVVWIIGSVPLEAYIIFTNSSVATGSYSWSTTHSAKSWSQIIMSKSYGQVYYDRWIPVAFGLLVFFFFGFGKEAMSMYTSGLHAIGLGRVCACLNKERIAKSTGSTSSWSSKARALLRRKHTSSSSGWIGGSGLSPTSTITESDFAKDAACINIVPQISSTIEVPMGQRATVEHNTAKQTLGKCASSFVGMKPSQAHGLRTEKVPVFVGSESVVHSAVNVGEQSSEHVEYPLEMIVRKEVRQGSEQLENVPQVVYHAR